LEFDVELKEKALIMANARRLIKRKKAMLNAQLYSELFGCGSGTARMFCRNVGIDPDGNKTSFNAMCEFINEKAT
jgi:hypothetical protein